MRLKGKNKCSTRPTSFEDFAKKTPPTEGEAFSGVRVEKGALRFKDKKTRICGLIESVFPLSKKSEGKCKLSLNSASRSGITIDMSREATREDHNHGDYTSQRANGRSEGNKMTFNWKNFWPKKTRDEIW